VPEAGQKTARMILEDYSRHYEITLVCFYNSSEEPYLRKEDFSFCRQTFFYKVSKLSRILGILFHPFLPINEAFRTHIAAERRVRKILQTDNFEALHAEFTACGYYFRYAKKGLRKIISEHDVTYQALERKKNSAPGLKKLFFIFEYWRQKRSELRHLMDADEILVHNSKDKAILIGAGISADKIRVIKPYVNPVFKSVKRNSPGENSLLFWGAMGRPENSDAMEWFVTDILPVIKQTVPDVKLYIVGANPPEKILRLASENIIVTGFVENPVPYFEKAAAAIAPLRLGAGIKVKVLECLAAGLPVVATSVGAEGVEKNKSLLVTDNPAEFARLVIEEMRN
jgi:glycosyltransferase involved in cell wall biosynthesis